VIIAIDISSQLLERDTLRSVLDVTTQLTNLLTRFGSEQQRARLRQDDVLIAPVFPPEITSGAFTMMSKAIQAGYDAVMQQREVLERFALDEQGYQAYLASLRDPRMESLPVVDFIRLNNNSPLADSVIETRLSGIKLGETLDVDDVERAMNSVYGLEYFQNVRYSLVTEPSGETGLEVDVDERSWGPNYLQLGMQYSSAGNEDALFGLAASYLRTAVTPLGAEWRATFVVGDEPAVIADRYQPFGPRGVYFFAPSLNLESRQFNVFVGDDRVTEAQLREYTVELAVGREFPSWGEYRFGVRVGAGDTKLRVGDPTYLPENDFHLGEVFGRFSIDTLDGVAFPRSGSLASIEYRASRDNAFGADANFDQLVLTGVHAKTWGRHTLLGTLRYDQTVSGTASTGRLFRMGGFMDLSGLNRNQLNGQFAARIGASYYRRIGDLALFPAFAGVSVELGNVWQRRSDISLDDTILGGSFWAGVSTPVGPVYVGYGVAEGGDDAFYVFLGRVF
jgi:NTE family protein